MLAFFARHGRLILVLGLAAGVGLPDLAAVMKPYLPHMVATTLFLAALRIGPQQAIGKLRDLRDSSCHCAGRQLSEQGQIFDFPVLRCRESATCGKPGG